MYSATVITVTIIRLLGTPVVLEKPPKVTSSALCPRDSVKIRKRQGRMILDNQRTPIEI